MARLTFTTATPVPAHPLRADIALFVGLLRTRDPEALGQPVGINTWDDFDEQFAWDGRAIAGTGGDRADTYLGAAVRSFFAHGGRKCWVIAVKPPPAVLARREPTDLDQLLPPGSSPTRSEEWRGAAHLLGLPEVSFLCFPDLPDVLAVHPPTPPPAPPPPTPERFVASATWPTERPPDGLRRLAAPRCDAGGFARWAGFVDRVSRFLGQHAREVQLVVAMPRPTDDAAARLAQWHTLRAMGPAGSARTESPVRSNCASAFVQVAYPWLRLRAGSLLPGGLEPPDGSLAGILASNALRRGTFASAAGTPTPGVLEVDPELSAEQLARVVPPGAAAASNGGSSLAERISVFGPASAGMQLLTDVTTATDAAYQPANINRLTSAIVRTARLAGEMAVFDNNGEALWARLREGISVFLTDLWRDGALDGATAAEAFTVRCDRATMTQADLDAGRAVVTVEFAAASPITEITIVLGLDEGGQVSLRETRLAERKEAA